MNPSTFIIRDDGIRNNAIDFIRSMPIEPIPEIIIRDHHKDRSVAQNSLYWLWLTFIAGSIGDTKDSMHYQYKKMFLVHIFERDDMEYAAMIQAVRTVYKSGMKAEADHLASEIVKLTSTRKASVAQFTEYLQDIDHDAIGKNIQLPHPEDRYNLAMGIGK